MRKSIAIMIMLLLSTLLATLCTTHSASASITITSADYTIGDFWAYEMTFSTGTGTMNQSYTHDETIIANGTTYDCCVFETRTIMHVSAGTSESMQTSYITKLDGRTVRAVTHTYGNYTTGNTESWSNTTYNPPISSFVFPMSNGSSWSYWSSYYSQSIVYSGGTYYYSNGSYVLGGSYVVEEEESVIVPAGTFDCLRLREANGTYYWMSPVTHAFVKYNNPTYGTSYVLTSYRYAKGNSGTGNDTNNPPVVNEYAPSSGITNEDVPFQVDLTQIFSDPDGDALSYTYISSNCSISIFSGLAVITPSADYNGNINITFSARDAYASAFFNYTLTVRPVNDAPRMTGVLAIPPFDENTEQTYNLAEHFYDVDGDMLSYTITCVHAIATVTDGIATFTPMQNWHGIETIVINVSDGNGGVLETTTNITVNHVNNAPIVTSQFSDVELHVNCTTTIELAQHFTDVDGDALTYATSPRPTNIDVTIAQNGSATLTPHAGWYGIENITFVASDGLENASALLRITVLAPGQNGMDNHAPANVVITSPIKSKFNVGEEVLFSGIATDEDNDTLTYIWRADGTEFGRGRIVTHSDLSKGTHNITLRVTDGKADAQISITIYVVQKGAEQMPLALMLACIIAFALVVIIIVMKRKK